MSFISTFCENVAAIKALGVDDLSSFLLFYIGTRALDTDTRRLFEEHILIDEIPKLDNLLDFVAHRCKILENSGFHETKQVISSSLPKKSKGDGSSGKTSLAATTTKTVKCSFSERDHAIYRCFGFKRKSVTERREFVAKKKLCFICLNVDHIANVYEPTFTATNVTILNKITTSMPNEKLPNSVRERYGHLQLADPDFDTPGPIDMLIGGDLYPLVLCTKSEVTHSPGLPSALNTQLGWVVVGALKDLVTSSAVSLVSNTTPAIDEIMQQFWESKNLIDPSFQPRRMKFALPFKKIIMSHSNEDLMSNDIYQDACSVGLGSSRSLALNRLYNLEHRLSKDPELYKAYRNFMEEYITLCHMKLATREGIYFIPRLVVVKRQKNDLKIRVVFDASAVSSLGRSLNDCLVTGPKLQTDISDILLQYRFHKYLFIADIVKMYRQILICDEDRVYQHILWRNSPREQVREYELCTITYGMNAAPYFAIRCLHQLDLENGPEFPLATNLLRTSTYVDDIIAGADSVEDIVLLQQQVIKLLQSGSFQLKKWASNCSNILQNVPREDLAMDSFFEPNDIQAVKVLGLYWNAKEDLFGYRSSVMETRPSKRSILSTVARLYDLIGALSLTIFWAKCIMQNIWGQKLDWDALVSEKIAQKWNEYISKLNHNLSSAEITLFYKYLSNERCPTDGIRRCFTKGICRICLSSRGEAC
ncbi:hypothetical protein QTP88_014012 [Uroleucon formosanum]